MQDLMQRPMRHLMRVKYACALTHASPGQVPYYDYALDLILDADSPNNEILTEEQHELVESAAEMLYGLIHVRYILTSRGMGAMFEKFKNCEFGRCPRVHCNGQACLPIGTSDVPRQATVKIFCPKCCDIYYPRSKYQARLACSSSLWLSCMLLCCVLRQPGDKRALFASALLECMATGTVLPGARAGLPSGVTFCDDHMLESEPVLGRHAWHPHHCSQPHVPGLGRMPGMPFTAVGRMCRALMPRPGISSVCRGYNLGFMVTPQQSAACAGQCGRRVLRHDVPAPAADDVPLAAAAAAHGGVRAARIWLQAARVRAGPPSAGRVCGAAAERCALCRLAGRTPACLAECYVLLRSHPATSLQQRWPVSPYPSSAAMPFRLPLFCVRINAGLPQRGSVLSQDADFAVWCNGAGAGAAVAGGAGRGHERRSGGPGKRKDEGEASQPRNSQRLLK